MYLKYFFILILSESIINLHAQDTTKRWSLQNCLTYAKQHNISLQQATTNIEEAQYDQLAAKGQLLPSIGAGLSQNYNIGLSVDPITNLKKDETSRSNSFSLGANWTLFNGFRVLNNIKKTSLDALASHYQKQQIAHDLTINIVNAYLQILVNKELLTLTRNQQQLSERQVVQTKKQLAVGEKAPSDLVDVQSQLASDIQQTVQSENNVIKARQMLAQYLQLKNVDKLNVAGNTFFPADTVLLSKTLDDIYKKALNIQPAVKLQKTLVKSAQRNIKIVRSNFLPNLSFSSGAGTDYSDQYIVNNVKVPFSKQFHDNLGYYFQFRLNIPIFNNFSSYATYRKAKLEVVKAKEQSALKKYQLWQTIQAVYSNAKLSIRAYKAGKQSYQAQKKALEYAGERYKSGLITSYDYELARNKMITAASQMLQSKYEYWYNLLLLKFYFTNHIGK